MPAAVVLTVVLIAGCGGNSEKSGEFNVPEGSPTADPARQIELLEYRDDKARLMAAKNLGRMGAAAESAIPALEDLADNDPDEKVRAAAAAALEQIRGGTKTE